MGKTVTELKRELTWRELQRWIWIYDEKPFGEDAQDLRFIDLFTFYANSKREKGKPAKPLSYFTDRRKKKMGNVASSARDLGERLKKMSGKFRN